MDKIKCRALACVKCGLTYPDRGTLWKVVNYSTGDNLWIVENCYDKSFYHYETEEKIRKILGIPLDK